MVRRPYKNGTSKDTKQLRQSRQHGISSFGPREDE